MSLATVRDPCDLSMLDGSGSDCVTTQCSAGPGDRVHRICSSEVSQLPLMGLNGSASRPVRAPNLT